MLESQREKVRGIQNHGRVAGCLRQEAGGHMVRSHGATVQASVLALLPTYCVTFGKLLPTLGLSFFICK